MGIILLLIQLFTLAIVIRALLSWIDPMGRNPVSQLLTTITEPVLAPIRNLLGGGGIGGLDLSPLIAILILQVLGQALAGVR